jgi:hypothetical protein
MISLRPSSDFSANGALRGGIIAYDEANEPLWESRGTWSDRKFLARQAQDLAESVGVTVEHAHSLLNTAVREARKAGDESERLRGLPTFTTTELPVISVSGRQLRDLSDDGWDLVRDESDAERRLYALGGAVVDLVRRDGRLRPRTLVKESLRWHLARKADWQREGQGGQPYPVPPPRDVLEDMLAHPLPPVLPLTGMVYTPIVSADGGILTSSGYHANHGYYLDLGKLEVPPVPARPTPADLENARRLILDELLIDFRFADAADRTHAVEALLAPFIRPLIKGPTPLRMIEAPTPGSGKGLLAMCVGLLVTGGSPRSMTEGKDDDEWRRRITASVMDAQPITLLDNIRLRLESGSLASVLTATEWSDRLLGASRIVTVPVRTTWLATANNPSYSEEVARRVVRIRIDTGEERPWERTGFRHDPLLEWVRKERDLIIWALLVLAAGWIAAGKPRGAYTMGSYEEWAAVSGGILDVAGLPGFLTNRAAVYQQAEQDLEIWRELVLAWWEAYGPAQITVDKLFDLAKERKMLMELRAGRSDRGARTALGIWLASMTDRVVTGLRIRRAGESRTGGAQFQLEPLPGTAEPWPRNLAEKSLNDGKTTGSGARGSEKGSAGSAVPVEVQAELNLSATAEPSLKVPRQGSANEAKNAELAEPAEPFSDPRAPDPSPHIPPFQRVVTRFRESAERAAIYNDKGELVDADSGEPIDPEEWVAGDA